MVWSQRQAKESDYLQNQITRTIAARIEESNKQENMRHEAC